MGDDEAAAVEHSMADQAIDPTRHLGPELGRLGVELFERLGEAVAERDVAPGERPLQLVLVVPGDAQRPARSDQCHDEAQHRRRCRAAVDEIAQEDRHAALGMFGVGARCVDIPAEFAQQGDQLVVAAVDVADDVERAAQVSFVGPEPFTEHVGAVDLVDAAQHEDPFESFAAQVVERAAQRGALIADHVRAEVAVGPRLVAFPA